MCIKAARAGAAIADALARRTDPGILEGFQQPPDQSSCRKRGCPMAQMCEVCGKGPQMGNRVETRGKAKYLGGVGTKVTGISRRQFKPNLQRVRITTKNGTNKRIRVCVQCLRSGAIKKAVRSAPFRMPAEAEKK
jgi:large subunit ribosomal protein L28